MDDKKVNSNAMSNKVSSRNRNKNKNKTLQAKVKERELAKKERVKKLREVISIDEQTEEKLPIRDDIVIAPERSMIDSAEDKCYVDIKMDNLEFVDNNETNDKFEIVEYEDGFVETYNENKEIVPANSNIEDDNKSFELEEKLDNRLVEEPIKYETDFKDNSRDSQEEYISIPTNNVEVEAKRYISFEKRVLLYLLVIVISFFIAGVFIYKAVTYGSANKVVYSEKSDVLYNVCLSQQDSGIYYEKKCLDEGMEYVTNLVDIIPISFNYKVNYSSNVETKLSYYVVSKLDIYREENSNVLNTKEDILVDRTYYDVKADSAEFGINVDVPVKKYVNYSNEYKAKFGLGNYSNLEIILYVDNGNTIRKVSSISLPLSEETFGVTKTVIDDNDVSFNAVGDMWGSINTSYAVVGLIFVLFGLLGVIKLGNLVYKVAASTSLYTRKLNKILREYDREIVISRNGYSIDGGKKLIKVESFSELLDARDTLDKPIVYVKVNNVKSEFYVEDSETIYKYTMKEADFEEGK